MQQIWSDAAVIIGQAWPFVTYCWLAALAAWEWTCSR
jgi:hypothetical protein